MRSLIYIALSALAAVAATQSDNSFNVPKGGWEFTAGQPTELSWTPTTDGTVTLKLQIEGDVTPDSGIVLASNIPNSGSYTFTPPSNLGPGSDYTIEIIDDDNPDNINFTPTFSVDGTTGTATGLPTTMVTETATNTDTATSTTETETESTTEATTSTMESTTTEESSTMTSTMTTSASTTTSEAPSTTSGSAPETTVPSPGGAGALAVPGGLISAVFGLMALM